MKKRKYLLAAYIFLIFLLTGCSRADSLTGEKTATGQDKDYDWLPQTAGEKEILLYDKYDQRIITYDIDQHKVIQKNNTLNYLQFEFNDLTSDIYTTGHSIENDYKIIKLGKDKIDILYEADQMEALFPLAYRDPEYMIFLKCTYQDNGAELYGDRVVCRFNEKTKTLSEIAETKGMRVTNGAIVGDMLYFTEYDAGTDRYILYMLSMSGNEKPILLLDNLAAGEIYSNNDALWISDASKIYCYGNDAVCFPKKILNYFYSDNLLQIDISANGSLELIVTNVETKKLEADIEGVIDVRIFDGKIKAYTDKATVELGRGMTSDVILPVEKSGREK
ncbi:MAG: hypothetical protein HFH75_06595 [Lachnospiraceae bacterium]|jgi:hypothetical protein|nr:hypothetical protein [Lachnospiraceae bacterium]